MMISPQHFGEQYKNCSVEELIKVKDKLIEENSEYERKYILKTEPVDTSINPPISPDTRYKMNYDYLKVILDMITSKVNLDASEVNLDALYCPNCGGMLNRMMPTGNPLYCRKCEKYYINNNNTVGAETSSPYKDTSRDY